MTMDRLVNRTYSVLLALLLTLAFAGCRQEPLPESGDAIRFSVSDASAVSLMTKAGPTDEGSLIANGSKVKLYGSYDKATTTSIFGGDDLTCAVDGDIVTWSYDDPIRYWDKQYTYDFRAVFPKTADIQSGSGTSVVVNFGTSETNGDYDLMVASAPGIKASEQIVKEDKTVSLKFLHACAAVRVMFRDENVVVPAEGDPTYNYTLQSFKLTGLRKGGTLTYTGDSSVDEAVVSGWVPDESATDLFVSPAGTAWGVPKDYTAFGGWHYVVPQQSLDGAKLVFTYKVGNEVMPVTLDLKTSAITSWEPGKAYTYKVTILAHSIDFTVSCEGWTTVGDVVIGPIG